MSHDKTLSVEQEVVAFKRRLLAERLAQLPIPQIDFFWRIFPRDKFPDGVPAEKLSSAIDLCDRSIRKNLAGRTTGSTS